jgi:hypothetical protein
LLGAAGHALMDLPTSYGTRLLSPFVSTWYALDWMPIIDVYLWAVLLLGVLAARMWPARRTRSAQIALAVLALDYAGHGLLHERALEAAATHTATGAVSPCASRPTLVRHPAVIEAPLAGPSACIQAAALPTFLSPFSWRIVRQYPNGYELSERNVLHVQTPVPSIWMPADTEPAIARARATRTGRVFLDFSRFPSSHVVSRGPDEITVRVVDVRFLGTPLRLAPDPQARAPAMMTVVLTASGKVLREKLGD